MEKMRGGSGLTMNYEPRTLNCSALRCLAGLLHLAGAEASGTDVDMTGGAVDQRVDPMSVWELSPFAHVMGVADPVDYLWPLPADCARTFDLGHPGLPPIVDVAPHRTRQTLLKLS